AAKRAAESGVPWRAPSGPDEFADAIGEPAVVVDAVFGVGLTKAPAEPFAAAIRAIDACGAFVVSADVPSGVDSDTGRVPGRAVRANLTVTFTALKPGLLLYPGAERTGHVSVADVGVPADCLPATDVLEVWDAADYRRVLPVAPRDAHKNDRGRVLVVAGSRAYTGAAALAVAGAQRMGAGYVTLAVPESIAPTMQVKLTSAVVVGLPENPGGTLASKTLDAVDDLARDHDAVVVGPGLTVASGTVLLVRKLVRDLALPLVLDADGLNALVDAVELLDARQYPTVLTPHPGELARLLSTDAVSVQSDRVSSAMRLTGEHRCCVLKGARTVVAGSGRRVVTLTGNPGMATAGAGDVLAGMTGTLLAQGVAPLAAGALAAHLHGAAGDAAADALTETCVMAEDIADHLPQAVRGIAG
ncbi:MAG: NAD(P)H-hydrate dehydratase, partial [Actinobacteria bacterium]